MPEDRPRVTVCRGCCCGTTRKHPQVDHDGQVRVLREALDGTAEVRLSDCLDACAHSNLLVVHPSPAARAAGAKPLWLGRVLDDRALREVIDWISGGGPGVVPPPASLRDRVVTPPNARTPPRTT
ncbi:hypothetical protein Q5530_13275 [Saccharothrix sp. BKS2]|uniref:hypothetical protein n=1 Tax=Saccharothrix sp. BKS2 TaxID=3064400 RepID=UPI0039E95A68